jgi:hypothetical protein
MKWLLLVLALACGGGNANVPPQLPPGVAPMKPPAPEDEKVIERPDHVWIGGRWEWRNNQWDWLGGHWDKARPGFKWQDGHWEPDGDKWRWHEGTWVSADAPPSLDGP